MTTPKKLWHILTSNQRRAATVLLGLMLIGMALETLGIGMVIPALALMSQIDIAVRYPALASVLEYLGNPSRESLVIVGMLILVGINAFKALFLALLVWWQMRFVYDVQADLSQRLLTAYLRQPYIFHLQRNSAQLIRNAMGEVSVFALSVLRSGLTLLAELLVLLGISALLLTVEWVGALIVVTTLGLAGWGFHRLTRQRILRWGKARQKHDGLRIQHLQQGLGGAKDVKLLGREADFLAQYRHHNYRSARVSQLQNTLQQLPRLWIELLAVSGIAILVLVMIEQGKSIDAILPALGLFGAAAFRLMPSFNRVLSSVQSIRYALPVIDMLHAEFTTLADAPAPTCTVPFPFRSKLKFDSVSFRYPGAEAMALRGVSFQIPCAASIGFVGQSGAGKSTLVDILLGLLTPDSGRVKVDGTNIQQNLRGWQDQIGYVPQAIFLTDDTLRRNVAFGLPNEQIDESAVWCAIRAAQLEEFVNDLPQGLDTLVGERGIRLSGGQRQRIGIARALYHDPSVLVLDEATSSLDTATENGVMEAVRALHGAKTIIIVAHRLSTVEHCDQLIRIEKGQVMKECGGWPTNTRTQASR